MVSPYYYRGGRNRKKIILTNEGKAYLREQLNNGHSYASIAKELGVCNEVISRICKEEGITTDNRRKFSINENYFTDIDSCDKAYWLGFLDADGYINKGYIQLIVQYQDGEILDKFLKSIGSNKKKQYQETHVNGKSYPQYKIHINCRKMTNDLERHGCFQKKSLALKPPSIRQDLIKYWILGYMDGDECVSLFNGAGKAGYKMRLKITFTGTYEVIEFIKEFFGVKAKILREHRCANNTYKISITEGKAVSFLEELYSNPIISELCLQRKKNKLYTYLKYRKEHYATEYPRNSAEQGVS